MPHNVPNLTPAQRRLRAQIAAYASHVGGRAHDLGEAGQAGLAARFEREVDPEGILELAERARRAELARKAHMARLALASSRARAARKGAVNG